MPKKDFLYKLQKLLQLDNPASRYTKTTKANVF